MKLDEVDIPSSAKEIFKSRGITELYPPQEDALRYGVLKGLNLVLASPTASGKTLVAELCAIKHVIKGGKVLYLTPLVSLASEKYEEFKQLEKIRKPDGRNIRVAISTGDYDSSDPWLEEFDIIITTNEKADSLLRHRAHWIRDVSLVIADEIHLIHDEERGPTLEVVLARLRQVRPNSQILALSATIRNADEIGEWINAGVITTDWRPVKLKEGVILNGEITFNDGSFRRIEGKYADEYVNLVIDVVKQRGQVLVFGDTRARVTKLAKKLAPKIKKLISKTEAKSLDSIGEEILRVGEKTKLSELLASLIKCGVAFHHAGVHPAHRKIIEDKFREGYIKAIAATPTLAYGVNLPARMVVIQNYKRYVPGYGYYSIPILEYKQMAGRAGRPGYDDIGEAVLIANSSDEQDYLMENYVYAEPEKIWSKLGVERILRPHVLSTVASGFAHSEEEVLKFFEKTFYAFQYGLKKVKNTIKDILKFLISEGMIEVKGDRILATKFGRRVSELYIDPISAIIIRDALKSGAKRVTDFSFLHLICHTPDLSPKHYPSKKERDNICTYLDSHREELMVEVPEEWEDPIAYEELLAEVKMAMVLESWINEASEDFIADKYGIQSGDLFRLVKSAEWLMYATYELARLFDHRYLMPIISVLQSRIKEGVKTELLPLVKLEGIGRVRARMLFNAGLRTIRDLKRCSISKLLSVPTIGPSLAKSIKEQVGGIIKPEELKMLKKEKLEQKTLIEEV